MSIFKRKKLLVDPKVQGALLVRAAMYWAFSLSSITLLLLCWRIIAGPARPFYMHFDDMWFFYGPALVASIVLLPIVLLDTLRLSNRFVGPLFRVRTEMRKLARGERVEPLRFRDGDFWQEIAREFNAVAARVQGAPSEEVAAQGDGGPLVGASK
jgi:hypothetical protein